MSIRYGLLTLLERRPMYGYQLRQEFEASTGATWPLNVGQVYTTLARLERDGLVAVAEGADGGGGADGDSSQRVYAITDSGHAEVRAWFATPVRHSSPPRDELAIKLAIAVTVPDVDVAAIVQRQRTATVRALQDYTRLKRKGSPDESQHDLAWSLVLDSLIFAAEAEVRWLDHCESRLARSSYERQTTRAPVSAPAPARADEVLS